MLLVSARLCLVPEQSSGMVIIRLYHLQRCVILQAPIMLQHMLQHGRIAQGLRVWTLTCRQFRPLISKCYYNDGDAITRFVFELTEGEASNLMAEFERRKTSATAPQARQRSAAGDRKPAAAPAPRPSLAEPTPKGQPDCRTKVPDEVLFFCCHGLHAGPRMLRSHSREE